MTPKSDDNKTVVACLAILGIVMVVPSIIWRGYVLVILWKWFMVSTFEVRALSIPAAIGVSLIVSYMTHQVNWATDDATPTAKAARSVMIPLIDPAFVLLIGWIVNHWMQP